MRRFARTLVTLVMPLAIVSCTEIQYVKEEPPAGAIKTGKTIYVDDGTCPEGEIKEVTGGKLQASLPRTGRCVKRPQ